MYPFSVSSDFVSLLLSPVRFLVLMPNEGIDSGALVFRQSQVALYIGFPVIDGGVFHSGRLRLL